MNILLDTHMALWAITDHPKLPEKAKELIMKKLESTMEREMTEYIKEQEAEAKLVAHDKAKDLIVGSMQRYAEDVVNEQTVSTITLPNYEM